MQSCEICKQWYQEEKVSICCYCKLSYCDAECALWGVYCPYCGHFICMVCKEEYECLQCGEVYCSCCSVRDEIHDACYCKQCAEWLSANYNS